VARELTTHLLSVQTTPIYAAATQHRFLSLAGRGYLPLSRLALWLSQDRIYAAHAYPRFIGALISRIPFHPDDPLDGAKERFRNSVLRAFVRCLDNIVLEVHHLLQLLPLPRTGQL
jgi:thiaminase